MKVQLRSRRAAVRVATPARAGPAAPEASEQNRQAVSRALGRAVQPSLVLGRTDDPLEAHAEGTADRVMRGEAVGPVAGGAGLVQRACAACEEEEKIRRAPAASGDEHADAERKRREEQERRKHEEERRRHEQGLEGQVQRSAAPVAAAPAAGGADAGLASGVAARIDSRRGAGRPLPASERSFFEPRFGAGFDDVRVHADADSAQLSQAIDARAFTVGQDIFFGHGQYRPGTQEGRHLIAHELTHTLQQREAAGPVRRVPMAPGTAEDVRALHDYNEGGAPKASACSTPSDAPEAFCKPYKHEKYARYQLAAQSPKLLAGISLFVNSKVAKLWRQHLAGGTPPQDLTGDFAADFLASPTTANTTAFLMTALQRALVAKPPPVSATVPVWAAPLRSLIGPEIAQLDDPASANQMNFNIPKDTAGNLAGGIGKDQLSCKAGAMPSPFNDERIADGFFTATRDAKTGAVTITPFVSYTVKDTVDLCPGDWGTALETLATVPISQFEATGIAGDVPFTVRFSTSPTPFTLPAKAP